MNILKIIESLKENNIISPAQSGALSEIESGKLLSVYRELRVLIYLGVLFVIAGIGLVVAKHFEKIGHFAIIASITLLFFLCVYYVFKKGRDYSNDSVESPNLAFDYVLLFACMLYSTDISYIETHFKIFGTYWKNYLLISTALFGFLSYRFDNRMALSMALSTLAAWFGFKFFGTQKIFIESHRLYALEYGFLVLIVGTLLNRYQIKKHFYDVYLNFASHFIFIAVISGIAEYKIFSFYFLVLIILVTASIIYAFEKKKFLYFVYALIYGYIGVNIGIFEYIENLEGIVFLYYALSSAALLYYIHRTSKKFKEGRL